MHKQHQIGRRPKKQKPMIKKSFLFLFMFISLSIVGQENKTQLAPNLIQNTTISGNWFLGYIYQEDADLGSFNLKRGYFTIKTKLNDVFSVRYTQDITLDKEGNDAGNVEMRLKYLYMKMALKKVEPLKNTYFEFGLIHRPWLGFEQTVNRYRVQGKMYIERFHVINSADFGILYTGLLGGKIDEKYRKEVNSKEPGKYGSFALGVFNGPGYHAIEQNNNKTIEGRLTLRPMPTIMPGLQLSYAFAYGQNNAAVDPSDFMMHIAYLTSESKYHTLALQYYQGKGDNEEEYFDANGDAFKNDGYSVFGEIKIPKTAFSLFGRYDDFVSHQAADVHANVLVGGIAYRFLKNKIILDVDQYKTDTDTRNIYELALEINF